MKKKVLIDKFTDKELLFKFLPNFKTVDEIDYRYLADIFNTLERDFYNNLLF